MLRWIAVAALFFSVARADTLGPTRPPALRAVDYATSIAPSAPAPPWYADLWKEGIGAFLGAFFAFLFVKGAEYSRDIFERERRNHRALNRLQHLFNDYLGILSDNVHVVTRIAANVGAGLTHWSFPRPLPIDRSVYEDLLSLEIVNELRSVFDTARKINDDIENAITGYEDVKRIYLDSVTAGAPNLPFYVHNAGEIVKAFQTGARFQEVFSETEVMNLLAHARILSRKSPGLGVRLLLLSLKSPKASTEEIAAERARLADEVKEVQAASRAKIDSIFGDFQPPGATPANPT